MPSTRKKPQQTLEHLKTERIRQILAAYEIQAAARAREPRNLPPFSKAAILQTRRSREASEWQAYMQSFRDLNPDELLEFAALFFIGGSCLRTLNGGIQKARRFGEDCLVNHIAEKSNINDMVRRGLQKLGIPF